MISRGIEGALSNQLYRSLFFFTTVNTIVYKEMRIDIFSSTRKISLTCVARRGLDDGVSRLEFAFFLSSFDDTECQTIFDGREGVEILAFRVDCHSLWGKAIDLDHGRVADSLGDVVDRGAVS